MNVRKKLGFSDPLPYLSGLDKRISLKEQSRCPDILATRVNSTDNSSFKVLLKYQIAMNITLVARMVSGISG